jgi:hypothetical protein
MLLSIGIITGRTFSQRFAWFMYSFAIWDIFYYVFLKILIGWPDSVFTWDILFLIPVVWTGPVITPVIVSLTMILFAGVIICFSERDVNIRILPAEWGILITGALIVFIAFIWDFTMYILQYFTVKELFSHPGSETVNRIIMSYIPVRFNWGIFIPGEFIILIAIVFYYMRLRNLRDQR